jgi:hypothetical protein
MLGQSKSTATDLQSDRRCLGTRVRSARGAPDIFGLKPDNVQDATVLLLGCQDDKVLNRRLADRAELKGGSTSPHCGSFPAATAQCSFSRAGVRTTLKADRRPGRQRVR